MQDQKILLSRKRAKDCALIIAFVSIICMFLPRMGLSYDSPWYVRFIYQFHHGNIIHLIINCWILIQTVFYYQPKLTYILEAYLASVLVMPVTWPTPVVGMSGLCFALMGRIAFTTRRPVYFLSLLYAGCMCGFLFPQISVYTHLYCLTLGALISFLNYPIEWKK